ncbi:MAG: hypothetical protein Q4G69_07005 [Planctomycetia bacterium]|nr:hypothetical protein [Planctomycetia bacterium]
MEIKSVLCVDACDFENNQSGKSGGALSNRTPSFDLHLKKASFTDNEAKFSGGAVYTMGYSVIRKSSFLKNSALEGDGGALMTRNQCKLSHSNFTENRSSLNGGGIAVDQKGTLFCDDTVFHKNFARCGGGVVFLLNEDQSSKREPSYNPDANASGGGSLSQESLKSNLSCCVFSQNTVSENGDLWGIMV